VAEVLTPEQVLALVPHRPPFRFIDELVEISETAVVGRYRFRQDESFYEGHFPGQPVTPGVILVEAMAQMGVVALGIYLASLTGEVEVARMATVFTDANVEFLGMVYPGDHVTVRSERVYFRRRKLKVRAEMTCRGRIVCSGELAGMGVTPT
jgi:3-hydroxyacyl-[acyl-carrier-protein] dehydratase